MIDTKTFVFKATFRAWPSRKSKQSFMVVMKEISILFSADCMIIMETNVDFVTELVLTHLVRFPGIYQSKRKLVQRP